VQQRDGCDGTAVLERGRCAVVGAHALGVPQSFLAMCACCLPCRTAGHGATGGGCSKHGWRCVLLGQLGRPQYVVEGRGGSRLCMRTHALAGLHQLTRPSLPLPWRASPRACMSLVFRVGQIRILCCVHAVYTPYVRSVQQGIRWPGLAAYGSGQLLVFNVPVEGPC